MIWSANATDKPYQVDPIRLAELATEFAEREAIARMKLECRQCAIGEVPRERLVPFHFVRDGVTHSGWTCPCRLRWLGRESLVLTNSD